MKDRKKREYHRHLDDEYIDEITIKVVPRFKTSGLSGDEWRVSANVEFKRKGCVVWSRGYRDMRTACAALGWFFEVANEDREFKRVSDTIEETFCMQPGCSEIAVNHFRMAKVRAAKYGVHSGVLLDAKSYCGPLHVRFCARHSERGDSDLEDCDDNLTLVEGEGESKPNPFDESPAGVVTIDLTKK